MKVAILTGTSFRHLAFAHVISKRHKVLACFCEAKSFDPSAVGQTEAESIELKRWFCERDQCEREYFEKSATEFKAAYHDIIRTLSPGSINGEGIIEEVKQSAADLFLVFGASLIREPLLDYISAKAFNLHLGLSPFYRGSGTNFWPFVHGNLEFVGATVHELTAEVDGGAIAYRARPKIDAADSPHSIGCKAIEAGFEAVLKTLADVELGRLVTNPQNREETIFVCRRKDFSADAVREARHNISNGLIAKCASEQHIW